MLAEKTMARFPCLIPRPSNLKLRGLSGLSWAGEDSNLRPTDYEFSRKASREFVCGSGVRSGSILSREFGGVGDKVRDNVPARLLLRRSRRAVPSKLVLEQPAEALLPPALKNDAAPEDRARRSLGSQRVAKIAAHPL